MHTHTHTLSLSLSLTHTHTHKHTHTHTCTHTDALIGLSSCIINTKQVNTTVCAIFPLCKVEGDLVVAQWQQKKAAEVQHYDWKHFVDESLVRQFRSAGDIGTAAMKNHTKLKQVGFRAYLGHKTHKRLKERFLIIRNRTKHANFRCNHLFQATYSTTENS